MASKEGSNKTKKKELLMPMSEVRKLLKDYSARTEKVFIARLQEHEEREDTKLKEFVDRALMVSTSFDAVRAQQTTEQRLFLERLDSLEAWRSEATAAIQAVREAVQAIHGMVEPFKSLADRLKSIHLPTTKPDGQDSA